jgi:hypothetical protein
MFWFAAVLTFTNVPTGGVDWRALSWPQQVS